MKEFKPINKWPSKKLHLRNIEMALEVLNGRTYQDVARLYYLSSNTVMQVYRVLAAKLHERYFGEPFYIAVRDKKCYEHKDMKNIIRTYHREYISWMTSQCRKSMGLG
jgi:hypothetical protein